MAKVRYHNQNRDYVEFKCPGCGNYHCMNVNPENGRPAWEFNHDLEKPTFSPSLLERSGHYIPGQPPADQCECCKEGYDMCGVCHSFIREGNIEFLSDCTHASAGKTVPMGDIELC